MLDLLFDYRYLIWIIDGALVYWLLSQIPTWQRVARGGTWNAERDYATWRVRNAILALVLLVPLLLLTTAVALR